MRWTALAQTLSLLLAGALSAQEWTGATGIGKWRLYDEIDPIDGTPTVILSLDSERGTSSNGQPIVLGLRCDGGTLEAFLFWGDYLGREAFLTTKIGHGAVQSFHWDGSRSRGAVFYPFDVRAFIRQLSRADVFIAETRPLGKTPITALFLLDGLDNALRPLRTACPR